MGKYRRVFTEFWNDSWIMELTPEQKYFFLYLITNPKTSQCGIYEISIRQMEHETGYNRETIAKLLGIFEACGKIKYSLKSNEICVINFTKYNYSSSPKIKVHIIKELEKVKDKSLVELLYGVKGEFGNFFSNEETQEITTELNFKTPLDFSEEELILHDELLEFWGFNKFENEDKRIQLSSFLYVLKSKGLLGSFSNQFQTYREYKEVTKEPLHGFDRFMGSEKEKYIDGGWNKENWEFKLSKLKKYATSNTNEIKSERDPL
jgi:hypothetical protein